MDKWRGAIKVGGDSGVDEWEVLQGEMRWMCLG